MDEMWSFVHDKSQPYWLWWAVDHRTGVPLAYCFGTREHKHLDELRALLAPFHIDKIYADDILCTENICSSLGSSLLPITGKSKGVINNRYKVGKKLNAASNQSVDF